MKCWKNTIDGLKKKSKTKRDSGKQGEKFEEGYYVFRMDLLIYLVFLFIFIGVCTIRFLYFFRLWCCEQGWAGTRVYHWLGVLKAP